MMMGAGARSFITLVLALHVIYLPGIFCLSLTQTDTCILAMEGERAEIACSYVLDKQNASISFKKGGSIVWQHKGNGKTTSELVLNYQVHKNSIKWGDGYKDVATILNDGSDGSCTLVLQTVAMEHVGTYTCTLLTSESSTLKTSTSTKLLVARAVTTNEQDHSNPKVILFVFVMVLLVYSLTTTAIIIAFWLKARSSRQTCELAPEASPPSSSTEPDAQHTYASLNPTTLQTYSDLKDPPPEQPRPRHPIFAAGKKKALQKVDLQMEVKNTAVYENINVLKSKKLPG